MACAVLSVLVYELMVMAPSSLAICTVELAPYVSPLVMRRASLIIDVNRPPNNVFTRINGTRSGVARRTPGWAITKYVWVASGLSTRSTRGALLRGTAAVLRKG